MSPTASGPVVDTREAGSTVRRTCLHDGPCTVGVAFLGRFPEGALWRCIAARRWVGNSGKALANQTIPSIEEGCAPLEAT